MDNIPEWEFGTLTLLRDTAGFTVMTSRAPRVNQQRIRIWQRQKLSSFLTTTRGCCHKPRINTAKALNIFRHTEIAWQTHLANAQFYARADNLQQWLAAVETRLGSLSQRLSASVGKRQLNTDLAGDSAASKRLRVPKSRW